MVKPACVILALICWVSMVCAVCIGSGPVGSACFINGVMAGLVILGLACYEDCRRK